MATRTMAKTMGVRRVKAKARKAKPAKRAKPVVRRPKPKAGGKAPRRTQAKPLKFTKGKTVKKAKIAIKKTKAPPKKAVACVPRTRTARHLENTHIRNLLTEIAGERALKIVGEMTEPLSDEEIAKSAGAKISEIRAILNKLHAVGIAVYDRTRNDEGWYTYTWRLTMDNAFKMIDERRGSERTARQVGVMETAIDHYRCPVCTTRTGARLNFEQAVEAGFRCPDCTEMLNYVERKR